MQCYRNVVKLSLPAIFENLMISLANIVDVAMVGTLGAQATAAAALNAQPLWLAFALAMITAGGSTILTARSWGAGRRDAARLYTYQGALAGIALGAILTFTAFLAATPYMKWMQAEGQVIHAAEDYMKIVGISLPFMILSRVLAGSLQACGDTVRPMKISCAANILNITGNYFLICDAHSIFGVTIPCAGLGVRGAAISTAFSFIFSALALAFLVSDKKNPLYLRGLHALPDLKALKKIISLGIPISGERVVLSVGHILYMSIVATLGTVSVSAHFLATTAESICYNPAFGISVAATALVGQSLGAGDEERADSYGHASIRFCAVTMLLVSVIMYTQAVPLISLFTSDSDVIRQGAGALRIVAFAEILFGISQTVSGALRGAGDAAIPLWSGIFCMLFIRLLTAHIFVKKMNLGLPGAWYAMSLDLCLRGIILYVYYNSKRWLTKSRRLSESLKTIG